MLEYILSAVAVVMFVVLAYPLLNQYTTLVPSHIASLVPVLFLGVIGALLASYVVWVVG